MAVGKNQTFGSVVVRSWRLDAVGIDYDRNWSLGAAVPGVRCSVIVIYKTNL